MAADDKVKASEINVDTHNHVVTLNGTVGSRAEKERAAMIARDTKGVNSVVNDLTVGPVATSGSYDRDRESASQTATDAKEKTKDTARDAKVKTEAATRDTKAKSERAADKSDNALSDA